MNFKINILKIKKEKRNTLNLHLSNQKQHKLNLHLLHYLIESELERNSNEKESFNHNFPNFNTLCPDLKQKKKTSTTHTKIGKEEKSNLETSREEEEEVETSGAGEAGRGLAPFSFFLFQI